MPFPSELRVLSPLIVLPLNDYKIFMCSFLSFSISLKFVLCVCVSLSLSLSPSIALSLSLALGAK